MNKVEPIYDCGLGLFFCKPAREIYYGQSTEFLKRFDKFLDYLNFPYPNICEFSATPGCYSYKGEGLTILYKIEECSHSDVKCFLTIQDMAVL